MKNQTVDNMKRCMHRERYGVDLMLSIQPIGCCPLATARTALHVLKGMPIDEVLFAARGVGRRGVRAEAALHCAGFAVRLE